MFSMISNLTLLDCSLMILFTWQVKQGSHPTWKTLKTWNFVIFFSRPGICSKSSKNLEF